MTIEIFDGSAVEVEMPVRVPEVVPPSVPTSQGIVVPVEGSLTAERLAHIVSVVTAKVIEELGGQQPGGGGAGINDTTIGTDTTWSSQQIVDDRAPAGWASELGEFGGETGAPVDTTMTINQGLDLVLSYALEQSEGIVTWRSVDDIGPIRPQVIVCQAQNTIDQLSQMFPGTLFALRAPDGTVTFQMPITIQ